MAKEHKAYKRVIAGMASNMENVAAMFVMLRLPRSEFIDMAGRAYDFMENWHKHCAKEEKEEKTKCIMQ